MALTEAAVMALALSCAPGLDPTMLVGIARHESGLNPAAVHVNTNGTRDVGLMQVNERNFAWLGLTAASALDPCQSLRAARDLLQSYSKYNCGNGQCGFANGYVARVRDVVAREKAASPIITEVPQQKKCDAPDWDVWGQADCRDNPSTNQEPADEQR